MDTIPPSPGAAAPPQIPPPGGQQPQRNRLEEFTLADMAAIRNLIRGGSVIDWHRLYFTDREQVDRFLRLNELDPANPRDVERLEAIRGQAVDYLERHL